MKSNKRIYLIYDGRAMGGNTDDATVMLVCYSLQEALNEKGNFGESCVIYSYLPVNQELTDERFEQIL